MQKPGSMEFQNSLNDQIIKVFRVLTLAFISGVIFFSGALLWIYSVNGPVEGGADMTSVMLFTFINAGVTVFGVLLSIILPRRVLENISRSIDGPLTAEIAISRIRSAFLMRIALLELPALFGLVTCYRFIVSGVIYENPVFALNAAPAFIMVVSLLYLMPSRERIRGWYEMIA